MTVRDDAAGRVEDAVAGRLAHAYGLRATAVERIPFGVAAVQVCVAGAVGLGVGRWGEFCECR